MCKTKELDYSLIQLILYTSELDKNIIFDVTIGNIYNYSNSTFHQPPPFTTSTVKRLLK